MNETAFTELEEIIERDYKNIAGMQISYDGAVIYEKYWNGCNVDKRIHIYSVTKSIVSALIGIAIDKGYITDVQQKVLEFFFRIYAQKRRKNNPKYYFGKLVDYDSSL